MRIYSLIGEKTRISRRGGTSFGSLVEGNFPRHGPENTASSGGAAMVVSVKVKLIGALRVSYGRDKVSLNIDHATVQAVIEKVSHSLSPDEVQMLIDPELNDPRPNVLILVNGKEISALKGLGTEVRSGDEVVIIPVTHGG